MHLKHLVATLVLAVATLTGALCVEADVVTDANARAADVASRHPGTPPAVRIMAFVQVSVFEAVNAITARYPSTRVKIAAPPGASVDAAVAAATRTVLLKLMPTQQAAIEADYQAALKPMPDSAAKTGGIAVGEQAAAACLTREDGMGHPDTYRPHTAAGVYVPTLLPAVPNWGKRTPWVMASGDQFRPGPPPGLTSATWARDYNEIKTIGGKNSTQRSPEQTAIAKFWEATAPAVYWPVARSVASMPGRDVTENARLLATAAMAMDDALVAVFDAKYTYHLWRPVTAIRNGDVDGNDATARDPSWTPLIDTPMHPEYPCAHCIVSASAGTVLQAFFGTGTVPEFSLSTPTAPGVVHKWTRIEDYMQEPSNARIWAGIHYRFSTVIGADMGRRIGEQAVKEHLRPL